MNTLDVPIEIEIYEGAASATPLLPPRNRPPRLSRRRTALPQTRPEARRSACACRDGANEPLAAWVEAPALDCTAR